MVDARELTKKICLLGDPSVGKTSLIRRFVLDEFDDKYLSTIGTKVSKKLLSVDVPEKDMKVKLTLMIWDVAGQQEYRMFHKMYLKGVEGAFSVGDITRRSTIETMRNNVQLIQTEAGSVPIVFLLNKADLAAKTKIDPQEEVAAAQKMHITALPTSALTGQNVEEAFRTLGTQMVWRWIETAL